MSQVRGWDLICGLLTVGEWHGPDCSLSRGSNFTVSKNYRKTVQRPCQGPQVAAYIRGWGRCHGARFWLRVRNSLFRVFGYCRSHSGERPGTKGLAGQNGAEADIAKLMSVIGGRAEVDPERWRVCL